MTRVWTFAVFVGTFGASKALVVLAPVIASGSLSLGSYGNLEWAIALAMTLVPVVLLGLTASVPYFILHRKKPEIAEATRAYGGLVALCGFLGALVGLLSGKLLAGLVVGATAAFGAQMLASVRLKSRGQIAIAALCDGGVYFVILVAALAPIGGGDLVPYVALLSVYLLILLSQAAPARRPDFEKLAEALRYSLPLIIPTFAMLCLVNSGRALGGYLLSEEEMGMYGILFRATAPAILVHQIFTTFSFPQIYAATDARVLDRYFVLILSGVVLALCAAYPAIQVGAEYVAALDAATKYPRFLCAYYWLSIQVVLWVVLASLESVMAREKLAGAQASIIGTALICFAVMMAFVAMAGQVSLHAVIGVQAVSLVVGSFLMVRRLRLAGIALAGTQKFVALMASLIPLGFLLS